MTSSIVLRLRTRNNLLELLEAGASGNWKVAQGKENEISKVQIFNWDGSLMLDASVDLAKTRRIEDGRLIVGLSDADAKITKCNPPLKWIGQNSVRYGNEAEESQGDEIETAEILTELPRFAPEESEEDTQISTPTQTQINL